MMRNPFAGGLLQGRARRSFWLLLAVAIVATGSLSNALGAPATPAAGVWFAVSAITVVVSITLAVRVMSALTRPPGGRGGR